MPTVTFVTPAGYAMFLEVEVGENLLHTALANNVEGILGECGGCLACGTCHVYVDTSFSHLLTPISADEQAMLELADESGSNSRLCCQIGMTAELEGLVLQVAARQP
jgi:ferredoxin, 2Fe-2S